jgi:hypothetical protein
MPAAGESGPPVNPAAPLSAEVPLAGLADGDYLLRLQGNGTSGAVELGRMPFRIVPRAAP